MIIREEVVTQISDVSGVPIDKVAQIKITKGRKTVVIDINADNIDAEMANISLKDAFEKGRSDREATPARRRGRNADSAEAQARRKLHNDARAWAQDNGVEVGVRGRVPDSVVDQYLQAQGEKAPE